MRPRLCEWISKRFYKSVLYCSRTAVSQDCQWVLPWPTERDGKTPIGVVFMHVAGCERKAGGGIWNAEGVAAIEAVVNLLGSNHFDLTKLAILAMYNGQVSELRERLGDRLPPVAFSTVDGFQGQERDLIIVCLARSNKSRACGFSTRPQRLNAAFSRAKLGLLVCGDLRQFYYGDQFGDLWDFIETQFARGCIVDEHWNTLSCI